MNSTPRTKNPEDYLVSFVVPVYNIGKIPDIFEKCIRSILNQTHKNLELIIINDCSTDDTADHIKRIVAGDKRVRVLENEENKGVFYSRKRGIGEIKGDFFAFVDADDWIDLNFTEILLAELLKAPEGSIATCPLLKRMDKIST